MKIINAYSALSETMTEDETKNFLANNSKNLLMHIGTIFEKGEPNVVVTAYYVDELKKSTSQPIRIKKVHHLKNKNIISYCIKDPNHHSKVQ